MNSQRIINEAFKLQLNDAGNSDRVLDYVCQALTEELDASRCIVWQTVGDNLKATHEFCTGAECFRGNIFDPAESLEIVLNLLSYFPDSSETGVLSVFDIESSANLSTR